MQRCAVSRVRTLLRAAAVTAAFFFGGIVRPTRGLGAFFFLSPDAALFFLAGLNP